uniref:Uncharacterized protein n=1 Tax=Phlebotomus papatasi TaxID=29031 RepID=A0A1B0DKS1_PHLPP
MGKLLCIAILGCLTLAPNSWANEGQWSWSTSKDDHKTDKVDLLIGEQKTPIKRSSSVDNETLVDELVDSILSSTRQGRNLDGYDEVYSDPSVKEAIQNGDDVEARNIIKDKLCSLGLMQCDFEDVEGKRPYLHPEDLIYAQPVAIRPVGRPQPSVHYKPRPGPIRGPGGGPPGGPYGPPKPMPPPRKVGYAPGKPPSYGPPGNPILDLLYQDLDLFILVHQEMLEVPKLSIHPNHQAQFTRDGSPFGKDKPSILTNAPGGSTHTADSSNVQQHVHHHYHHADGGIGEKITVPVPVPVPVPSSGINFSQSFRVKGY